MSVSAQAGDHKHKKHWVKKHFSQVDVNDDKMISKQEQLDFSEKRFDAMDEDGDGFLTIKEIEMSHLKHRMERLEKQSTP